MQILNLAYDIPFHSIHSYSNSAGLQLQQQPNLQQ